MMKTNTVGNTIKKTNFVGNTRKPCVCLKPAGCHMHASSRKRLILGRCGCISPSRHRCSCGVCAGCADVRTYVPVCEQNVGPKDEVHSSQLCSMQVCVGLGRMIPSKRTLMCFKTRSTVLEVCQVCSSAGLTKPLPNFVQHECSAYSRESQICCNHVRADD